MANKQKTPLAIIARGVWSVDLPPIISQKFMRSYAHFDDVIRL